MVLMAVAKKKAKHKKSSNKQPARTKKTSRKPIIKPKNTLRLELVLLAAITFCIYLCLSVYTQNAGAAGSAFKQFLTGALGAGAYILPAAALAACLYILFIRPVKPPRHKIYAGVVLFIIFITFVHVASNSKQLTEPINTTGRLADVYAAGRAGGGGVIGAALAGVCVNFLGLAGAYTVLALSGLACLIILTGRPFFAGLSRLLTAAYNMTAVKRKNARERGVNFEVKPKPEIKTEKKHPEKRAQNAPYPPFKFPLFNNKKSKPRYSFEMGEDGEGTEHEKILLVGEEIDLRGLANRNNPAPKAYERVKKPNVDIKIHINGDEADEADDGAAGEPEPEIFINTAAAYEEPEETDENVNANLFVPEAGAAPWEDPDPYENRFPEVEQYEYIYPSIDLLNENPYTPSLATKAQILENSKKLENALKSFGVEARVIEVNVGPTVTRYELSPGQGVKVSSISKLSDDLKLNLAAMSIRVEAPIPGKAAVGIEISNSEATPVFVREVIDDPRFKNFPSKLAFALGKDIAGNVVVADISRMPHMLIAGATGSGKSVCINTLITSIIYKSNPDEVKLLMIDPKVVELKVYNGIPHLMIPVVTDPKKAAGALNWAVLEMTKRYELFAETNVRELKGYNAVMQERGEDIFLPQIVIIIDELSDLMMTSGKEVESAICRLAQMARAAGIHLIIATQRPSVDVITGLIKANIPSKIAFSVSSGIDSRTIIGENGAERLLGRGDMLFYPTGMNKPMRVQGCYISIEEVEGVVGFIKQGVEPAVDQYMVDIITSPTSGKDEAPDGEEDEFTEAAVEFIVRREKASASLLQRQFRIGYNRASRLIEILEERGLVGPEDGSKPRKVLMNFAEWQDYKSRRRV